MGVSRLVADSSSRFGHLCIWPAWYAVVGRVVLFFSEATSCGNLGRAHEVANIFLKKFVIAVKLIVLFSDCLDAVKDGNE